MSHSKYTKRGKSLYLDNWNPSAKRFINTCSICGAQGYSPTIDDDGFVFNQGAGFAHCERNAIREELKSVLEPLPLDFYGRCANCAKIMDSKAR